MAKVKSYDRIFRENLEQLVVPLANRLLHLTIPALEEIPDDLHQTIERKPDFPKKVIHPDEAENFILHFEFQTADDGEMVERMLEYYAMLYWKYHLPIRQYVFYIGSGTSQMKARVFHEALSFQYQLINASEVDYRLFLNSSVPEEVLLAVLGDYQFNEADAVISAIIVKLGDLVPRSLRLKRYIKQTRNRLEILSNLRNLQDLTIKISEKMALVYDLKTDVRYKQGIEFGIEQGIQLMIEKMLRRGKLSHQEIAEIADIAIDDVEVIARKLDKQD